MCVHKLIMMGKLQSSRHFPLKKNYVLCRYVYWGEYPLTFAACLGQEECFRLMLSRGADPNAQDTNGNTVLHLLVIYEKLVRNVFFSIYC